MVVSETLRNIGINSPDEARKVGVVTFFCFLANTILLLGRNIGATLLLTGPLGADALPYCMVLVGLLVMVVMPVVASYATRYSSNIVLLWTTVLMLFVLGTFFVLFVTGLADAFPTIVYPLFFVLEEVIDSLLMVLFWQIGMACFTTDEAKRLIGIVNMGAALANLANGLLVALLIRFAPGGSFAILPAQMVLLCVQLLPNQLSRQWLPESSAATTSKIEEAKEDPAAMQRVGKDPAGVAQAAEPPWYMHPLTRQICFWQFVTVLLFSCIEFQYNATLAHYLNADGIAQVTANLASVASFGQTLVNLFITPWLLQRFGVWAALLVTPAAYIVGEAYIVVAQTVLTVFVCRAMDFIFRYTISDNTKQILYKAVPPHQLIDARAFTDGTIKKLGPMVLGLVLIAAQRVANAPAYSLVRPLAFCAAVAAAALMPLVLNLARISSEQDRAYMC